MSNLIPHNTNNPNLIDDNFKSIDFADSDENNNNSDDINSEGLIESFEDYQVDNNLEDFENELKENFSNGFLITKKENDNIETFSTGSSESGSKCPVCWGDKIDITNDKRDRFISLNNNTISIGRDSKYKKPIFFVPPSGDNFKEIGPYADTGRRALRYGPHRYGYTPESCAKATKGFKYFALQNNGWCCADNDLNHATRYGKSNRCYYGPKGIRGGGKQGGPWCNYIFEKTPKNLNLLKGKPLMYGDIININNKFELIGGDEYKPPFIFHFNSKRMTFHEHEVAARELGGELASITSWTELYAIQQYWNRNCWLGGKRKSSNASDRSSNTWYWIDGSPWKWHNFNSGEPNNYRRARPENGIQLYPNGKWNDANPNARLAGIYKIPKAVIKNKNRGIFKYKILPASGNFSQMGDFVYYNQNIIFKDITNSHYETHTNLSGRYSKNQGCPPGYETLKNDRECRYTVQKKLKKGRGHIGSWTNRPEGCFLHHNNHLYFNRINTSGRKLVGDDKSICKKIVGNALKGSHQNARSSGQLCSMKSANFIEDGNYTIKKIKVRCDDQFDMWIDGRKYSGTGWNRTFTFTDIPLFRKTGFIIAFRCYNGGGPGCLIAEIELNNGSIIFTDGTWEYSQNPSDPGAFLGRPYTYNYNEKEWRNPHVLGYNMKNRIRWNGKLVPQWDRAFVDSNFSSLNSWISQSNVFKKGYFYFKKVIGKLPDLALCRHKLSFGEALCYFEGNPDVKLWAQRSLSNNYEFKYNNTRLTWNQHTEEAAKQMGFLASITNKYEYRNAKKILYSNDTPNFGFWLGGIRTRNWSWCRSGYCWKWADGQRFSYTKWYPRYEPNNWRETRIHMWKHGGGTWNDLPSNYRLPGLYKVRKPNVNADINKMVNLARWHWKHYGCVEGRNFNCSNPPQTVGKFNYKGCYYDGHSKRSLPSLRGKVNSLEECREMASVNRDVIFGVMNGEDCYTGNDMSELIKNGEANKCSRLGRLSAYQVYKRRTPYDPLNAKLSGKNFSEKFTNMENSNMKYIIITLIIILISILFYFYKCN